MKTTRTLVRGFLSSVSICTFCAAVLATPSVSAEELWIEGGDGTSGIPQIQVPSFSDAVEKLGEAVVNIRTQGKQQSSGQAFAQEFGQGPGQNPFDFFFKMPQEDKQRKFTSLGSGFVIHPDGYIVTNSHVVENATKIMVSFRNDKKTYSAQLIGSDSKTDVALIKVSRENKLPSVRFGNSDTLRAGDWVLAIGNPFALDHTATAGIVSAKGRKIPGGKPYDSFIQTDASINPGNSGGPLFNVRGEVIGINTAIASPGGGGFNIGIGFAIPINMAKTIITQLKDKGTVVRGWLGVMIQPVSEDLAEALKLEDVRGALVADVIPGSPAATAGFQRGDVILSYDGNPVNENDDLPLMVAETKVGRKVPLEAIRGGKRIIVEATILELKDDPEAEPDKTATTEESTLGITVQDLTPDIARTLGLDDSKGVVISGVAEDSVAAEAGLRRGDVIVEVSNQAVNSVKAFKAEVVKIEKGKQILMLVKRGKSTIFLTMKKE